MVDPQSLVDARLQAHWAAQLAATVGRTLVAARADDSHSTFRWDRSRAALVQDDAYRSGLRISDLTLFLGQEWFSLDGRSLDEAFEWLSERAPGVRRTFNEPLPDHPVAHGARFALDHDRFQALSGFYAEAAEILGEIQDDVRCWPHHFDIATLLSLEDGAQTIGAGLSPGDGSYAEPYWYVNHWPAVDGASLPSLDEGGTWHTEGWIGAVLPASRRGDPRRFLQTAITASRTLLESHA